MKKSRAKDDNLRPEIAELKSFKQFPSNWRSTSIFYQLKSFEKLLEIKYLLNLWKNPAFPFLLLLLLLLKFDTIFLIFQRKLGGKFIESMENIAEIIVNKTFRQFIILQISIGKYSEWREEKSGDPFTLFNWPIHCGASHQVCRTAHACRSAIAWLEFPSMMIVIDKFTGFILLPPLFTTSLLWLPDYSGQKQRKIQLFRRFSLRFRNRTLTTRYLF